MLKLDKNFFQRLIFGALLVGVIIFGILFNPFSALVVFGLIAALGVQEFHVLTNTKEIQVIPQRAAIGAVLLNICFFVLHYVPMPVENMQMVQLPIYAPMAPMCFALYGLYIIINMIRELYREGTDSVLNMAYFIMGQVYIALPFALVYSILFYQSHWMPMIVLALFVTIWVNDTFAYLCGSMFGKHKMSPRISPKKSWEGFIGGNLFALASSQLFAYFEPEMAWYTWLLIAQVIVIFGTFGDLIESLIKRTIGVKDSGDVIPGHGGILDRFDSIILAIPAVAILLYCLILIL